MRALVVAPIVGVVKIDSHAIGKIIVISGTNYR